MSDAGDKSIELHKSIHGKIETRGKVDLTKRENFAIAYTPGVGAVSTHLAQHPEDARDMSVKGNSVAVVSDGSAVLGLGNIGPYGALPVMEGKALIFKELAGIDAWPIVLNTQDPDEIVRTVINIAPSFGGINLEDIKAPGCFAVEERLIEALDMPVMHDDQHGTAIVVLAGLINSAKLTKRDLNTSVVVVNGVGAAGIATMKLLKLHAPGIRIYAVDSKSIVQGARTDLTTEKSALLSGSVIESDKEGALADALVGADIFIGLSKPGVLTSDMIKTMNVHPIVFALANPVPEIMPEEAKAAGVAVIGTGRSDFPNQINNALVFPGVFRGALDAKVRRITDEMKLAGARALAALVIEPSAEHVIPDVLDPNVVPAIAQAIKGS